MPRAKLYALFATLLIGAPGCEADISAAEGEDPLATPDEALNLVDPFDLSLALHHAPIHFQDTDSTDSKMDYLTRADFDGDWRSDNNWDNAKSFPLKAHAYYSVVETCTHWYITYGFFHPRDWDDSTFGQEHENDMEGALEIVRKDGSQFGELEGMITIFHTDFFSYKAPGSPLTDGGENIDGTLTMQSFGGASHPRTSQQAKGHGLKAFPFTSDFTGASNQDGIIYFPSDSIAEIPSSGNDRDVKYRLIDFFSGPWQRQLVEASLSTSSASRFTFSTWGSFKGNTSGGCGSGAKSCSTNSANPSWGWNDGDDVSPFRGVMALDPAGLTQDYFGGLGDFSTLYLRNQFLTDLEAAGFGPGDVPVGFPGNVNLGTLYGRLTDTCP
jgi:hypothetical protein